VGCGRQILEGSAVNNDCRLPSQYAVDYEELLSAAREESGVNVALFLREHLLSKWRDLYAATVAHVTNIVRFQFRTFEYIFDLYSELEATGEVPYDQTIQDTVLLEVASSRKAKTVFNGKAMMDWHGNMYRKKDKD